MDDTWTAADGTVYDLTVPYIDRREDAWTCVGWLAGMGGKLHSVCDLPTPLMHNNTYSFSVSGGEMPDHETWCCRSPKSPCARGGGCSGSCNCGVDESVESMPGAWRMFAHRYDDGLFYNLGEKWWVEIHGLPDPIVEVDLREVDADSPDGTHWGWLDAKPEKTEPLMIWPREGLFEMQFPYGSKVEVERGKGRVVRLAVTEVVEDA